MISLKNHQTIKESIIQSLIAEDPSILHLGEVLLKDKERIQSRAGRLDLLLQDQYSNQRYEVEIQLGKTDESHIIRAIEYWDLERKRYPQYEHTAVIIAEDITSRFFNVISLFNQAVPIIAIQMSAFKVGEDIALTFSTILDVQPLGLVEEDEAIAEITDRNYWINQGSEATVGMANEMLGLISRVQQGLELKYTKFYIGLSDDGTANNFVIFRPRKKHLNVEIRLPFSKEIQDKIDNAGIDDIGYQKRWGNYRLRLEKGDIAKHEGILAELVALAQQNSR